MDSPRAPRHLRVSVSPRYLCTDGHTGGRRNTTDICLQHTTTTEGRIHKPTSSRFLVLSDLARLLITRKQSRLVRVFHDGLQFQALGNQIKPANHTIKLR